MFFFLLLSIVFLLCVYTFKRQHSRNWKLLSQYPGDYPLPIVGNGFQLGFDTDNSSHRIIELWKKHGMKNFRMTIGSEEWLLLSNPGDVATILNHSTELGKQVERNTGMLPIFGNSLSTAEGERWKIVRKMMASSFHFKTLEKRVEHVNNYCDRLFEVLHKKENCVTDIIPYLRAMAFDVVCHSLMGVDINILDNLDHPYFEASDKIVDIVTKGYYSYWRGFKFQMYLTSLYKEIKDISKILRGMSTDIIERRKTKLQQIMDNVKNNNGGVALNIDEFMEKHLSDSSCLLDKFLLTTLNDKESFPDYITNEEVTLICWTGHHTTSNALAYTLYCLAKHPEIQQKVLDEQKSIFNKDILNKPTNHDLNEMKYLEAVIKESIRVLPTITKISRHLKNDLKFKDGRVVPANTTLVILYEAMYQDPMTFPEPEIYKPERFFVPMHNHAFVPFSAGPRNCLGFRFAWIILKTTISNIIRRYELSLGGPGTEPQFVYRLMTESKNGIQLKLKKRAY